MRHAIVSGINLLGLFHLVGARRDDELAKLLEHEDGEAPSGGEKSCCCFDAGGDTFDTCMEVKVKLPLMLRFLKVELTGEERRDFCFKQLTSANGLTYNRYPAEAREELVECGTKHATCEDGEMSIKALLGLVRTYWQARVPQRCGDRLQEQFVQRFQLLIILERVARRLKLFKTCDFMQDTEEMSDHLFHQFRRLAYMVMPCKTTDGRSFFYALLKGLNGRDPYDIFKVVKKATYEVLSCEAVWAKEEDQHLSEGGCDVEFKSALAEEKKFKEDDWNQYKKWARVPRRCGDRLQEQFAQRFQLLIILERIARRFKLFKTCDFMEDAEEMSDQLFQQFRRLAYMVMPCKTTDGRSFFYGLLKGLNGRYPHDIFKVAKKVLLNMLVHARCAIAAPRGPSWTRAATWVS